eukprot:11363841-Heterocapsa_arctica.AAC.1
MSMDRNLDSFRRAKSRTGSPHGEPKLPRLDEMESVDDAAEARDRCHFLRSLCGRSMGEGRSWAAAQYRLRVALTSPRWLRGPGPA